MAHEDEAPHRGSSRGAVNHFDRSFCGAPPRISFPWRSQPASHMADRSCRLTPFSRHLPILGRGAAAILQHAKSHSGKQRVT